ncbi:MAG: hypothetical protein U1F57_01755 [bacterium]
MRKNSILALAAFLAMSFTMVGCGNESATTAQPGSTPLTLTPVSPVPLVSATNKPAMNHEQFVEKMLKTAIDLSVQNFENVTKCDYLKAAVGKIQSTKQGSKGSESMNGTEQACDDSDHSSAGVLVEIKYQDFTDETPPPGNITINGTLSLAYQLSDGDVRITVTSTDLSYHGDTYEFKKAFIDELHNCSGTVKIDNSTYKITASCKLDPIALQGQDNTI